MYWAGRCARWTTATLLTVGGCSSGAPPDINSFPTNGVTRGLGDDPPGGTSTGSGDDTWSPPPTGRPDPTTGMPRPDDTGGSGTSATSSDGSESGAPPSECGNGVIEPGERCDRDDLAGTLCRDIDPAFTGGELACDAACNFDTAGCMALDNPFQQCRTANAIIPDNNAAGLVDILELPAELEGVTIVDVDIAVDVDHTYLGDLIIDVNHASTPVVLHDDCMDSDDLDVTYDDDAGATINCFQTNAGQVIRPVGSLSTFENTSLETNWTLFIRDQAVQDEGTLQQWCVSVQWR